MRGRLFAAYLAVGLIGAIVIALRAHRGVEAAYASASCWGCRPQAHYVAARALPARHRLASFDIALPDGLPRSLVATLPAREGLVGRYLATDVDAGGVLEAQLLRMEPPMDPPSGIALEAIPIDEALRDRLEVGTWVRLCAADAECAAWSLRVWGVVCRESTNVQCSVLLEVPNTKREALTADYQGGKRVVTQGPWQGESHERDGLETNREGSRRAGASGERDVDPGP